MTTASELVAALPGIVWEADGTDYRMTYVSPRAHDLVGHDPAVWLAVPSFWEDHLHPDDRDRAMGGAQEAIASMGSKIEAKRRNKPVQQLLPPWRRSSNVQPG